MHDKQSLDPIRPHRWSLFNSLRRIVDIHELDALSSIDEWEDDLHWILANVDEILKTGRVSFMHRNTEDAAVSIALGRRNTDLSISAPMRLLLCGLLIIAWTE